MDGAYTVFVGNAPAARDRSRENADYVMPAKSCRRRHAGDAMPSPAPGIRERALRRRFAIIRFASGFYLDFFRTSSNRNSSATAQAMDTANPARPPDTPSIGAR